MSERSHHQDEVYEIPVNTRVYAIGDIHGRLDLLDDLQFRIATDLADGFDGKVHVVYLGDYVDRGADSKGVIDRLIELRDRRDGITRHFLAGNHEEGMIAFMQEPESQFAQVWPDWGGMETLASYGLTYDEPVMLPGEKERAGRKLASVIPDAHLAFLSGLTLTDEIGDYLFVHAGIDPRLPLKKQDKKTLTTIREPFLSWHKDPDYKALPKKIVHGHTPLPEPQNRPHRLSLDTGAWETGVLTAAVLEGCEVRYLQTNG